MEIIESSFNKRAGGSNSDDLIEDSTVPTSYGLEQNYPNPFNPTTRIDFQLPEKNFVSLKIYDIRGNLVKTLVAREMEAGYHSTYWNASNMGSGVYIYRLISNENVLSKKLLLLR